MADNGNNLRNGIAQLDNVGTEQVVFLIAIEIQEPEIAQVIFIQHLQLWKQRLNTMCSKQW